LKGVPGVGRIADFSWPKKVLVVSSIYILGLMSVGAVGGYAIYAQNKATEDALKGSQARADAASKAQAAILLMGKAQAELISASGPADKRRAAVLAIQASSTPVSLYTSPSPRDYAASRMPSCA
jgi:hypothetical protein